MCVEFPERQHWSMDTYRYRVRNGLSVNVGCPPHSPYSIIAHTCKSHSCQVTVVMLNKMYLVPAEEYRSSPPAKKGRPARRRTKQHPHTDWIQLCTKHREAELRRNAWTKEIADYMKQIMPAATISQPPQLIQSCLNLRQNLDAGHRLLLNQLPTHI